MLCGSYMGTSANVNLLCPSSTPSNMGLKHSELTSLFLCWIWGSYAGVLQNHLVRRQPDVSEEYTTTIFRIEE
jgi:hypothetical protein